MDPVTFDKTPVPAPSPRNHTRRLTDELKSLPVGGSFVADHDTARCYCAWALYNGYKTTRQMLAPGKIRVWRLS
jgi:hypothetical protein